MDYEVTINCINSFKKQTKIGFNYKIIVVDNGSDNHSFDILKEKFSGDNDINVISTNKNLGFANGNNFGFSKLKKEMDPDFVVFSNSDILLPDDGFFSWILESMKEFNFGVLGPSIYSINGEFHQSPIPNLELSRIKAITKYVDLIISEFKVFCKTRIPLFKTKKSTLTTWINTDYQKINFDKTLHGSFQIMSKKYLNQYKIPYHPGTFLYMEEDILKLRCNKFELPMIYNPSYKVYHLQAMSSKGNGEDDLKRDLFRIKNMRKSMWVVIKLIFNIDE